MIHIPRRHSHFLFGVIQSGLTCAVAAGIAELRSMSGTPLFIHWLESWLFSWLVMLPVVIFAAPHIHRVVHYITDDPSA